MPEEFPGKQENGIQEKQKQENQEEIMVKKIEEFPYLNPLEKVELLLLLGGFKEANEQVFESAEWRDGEANESVDEKEIDAYENLLKQADLIFDKKKEITKSRGAYEEDNYKHVRNIEEIKYVFAKTIEGIKKYKQAGKEQSDKLFGKIYGFPDTAIQVYGKIKETFKYQELPSEIRNHEAYAFLTFRLSRSNYQTEFETVKKWAEYVEQKSPKIYREYVEFMKKVEGR